MQIHRVEVAGLAHYSYIVSSNGQAVVIDPKRDFDAYVKYAEAHNLEITHILETHIHADYASGAFALAEASGAELWLSGHDDGEDFSYSFPHHEFRDGEELSVGELRFVALHTPGHTPEHLSFLLYDQKQTADVPVALFSGDFLFVGSVGRPDLLGETAKQRLAGEMFRSVRERISHLPDGIEVYPAHGSGSLCGAGMSERQQSTLGYERAANPFLNEPNESRFVEKILDSVPPFPDYYRRMKQVNSEGPTLLSELPGQTAFKTDDFKAAILKTGGEILDLRRPEAFGGTHIPGAFNIGLGQNLSMWAAWILPYDHPIFMVGDDATDYKEASRSLIRVGLDQIGGYLRGGMKSWIEAGLEQAHIPQISVEELDTRRTPTHVLDVRTNGEWNSGHIEGAEHIMAGELQTHLPQIGLGTEINVICGSGYRSSIAASILRREGFTKIVNVVGGMGAWNARKLPTTKNQMVCNS
ncbi:MAG: MBL fold metallo-hydrolase [Terriglobales bacterium]